jgi:tRNA (mo5U34)-methyltransferase
VTLDLEGEILSRRWFYRFTLPSGTQTPCALPPEIEPIHETRRRMVFGVLDHIYAGRWEQVEALDLACHQGWFTQHLGARGCRRVLGVDTRPAHVADARLMSQALGRTNVSFRTADVTRLEPAELGSFDVVLVLGLIYHLDNPIAALRLARAVTRGACLVETQVAPNLQGAIDWGCSRARKEFPGTFAVIDESDEVAAGNPEANVTTISLVPSLETLLFVLRAVGFSRVEVVSPPPGAYEQLASGQRVMVAAFADPA